MSRSSQRDITNRGDRPGTPSSAGSPRDKISNRERAAQVGWLREHQHDTLGYTYDEAEKWYYPDPGWEHLTLDAPREGHSDGVGDLIAGSGNSKIYKHTEAVYGEVEIDENGKIHLNKAEVFKRKFKDNGFSPVIPTTPEVLNKLLDKFEKESWEDVYPILYEADQVSRKSKYLNSEQLSDNARKLIGNAQKGIQAYITGEINIKELLVPVHRACNHLREFARREMQRQRSQGQSSS